MSSTDAMTARKTAATRLAIGLAQGIVLFLLQKADESKAWPATAPMLYAPLLVCALMVPMIPLAALSAMRRTALIVWTAVATVLSAILAVHAAWTGAEPQRLGAGPLSPPIFIAVAALLFIAHHLVQPADAARKPVAPYADYFDLAFTNLIRLFLSLAFTGAFWLLLFLAGALFKLIGVEAIQKLIGETAFAFPATGLMFAAAVHMAVQLTEARAGLVRGVRTVGLTLLAWLSPLMVVIAAGFLATLPFTGLAPLWGTKAATALLLAAAAALIILVNAAYQDGVEPPHAIPRWAARIAGLLLIPIVILAAYALWLRVDQYGLTPDRVFAGAYLVVAIGFTIGYALAALKSGPWMKTLEPTNLIMAAVSVLLLIALFTPIADPARLSVGSQVKRLEAGKVTAEKFDYKFLRFASGHYGRDAFDRLSRSPDKAVREGAAKTGKMKSAFDDATYLQDNVPATLASIEVFPKDARLPDDFVTQFSAAKTVLPFCGVVGSPCRARVQDLDSDDKVEVLIQAGEGVAVYRATPKGWSRYGYFKMSDCYARGVNVEAERLALLAAPVQTAQPDMPDITFGGRRLRIAPEEERCLASDDEPTTVLTRKP
jgi:hypothetical protein